MYTDSKRTVIVNNEFEFNQCMLQSYLLNTLRQNVMFYSSDLTLEPIKKTFQNLQKKFNSGKPELFHVVYNGPRAQLSNQTCIEQLAIESYW